jgi:hypothetical protein
MSAEAKVPRTWTLKSHGLYDVATGQPQLDAGDRPVVIEAEPVADLLERLSQADCCETCQEAQALLKSLGRLS